jgi:hypothetical protein
VAKAAKLLFLLFLETYSRGSLSGFIESPKSFSELNTVSFNPGKPSDASDF